MGKTAVCTKCGDSFRIGEARPPFEWKPTSLAEDSWIGVEPPEEKEELKHCIICDAPMRSGTVRCPECGANQVTGVVHNPHRRLDLAEDQPSFWARIPLSWVFGLCLLLLIGGVAYWFVHAMQESATQMQQELTDQKLVNEAITFLDDPANELDFDRMFGDKITDANLDRFLPRLTAGSADVRRATAHLIAHGDYTDLQPLVSTAETQISRRFGVRILELMDPRQILALTGQGPPEAREAAAVALCIIYKLERAPDILGPLVSDMPVEEKQSLLNDFCRARPQAVGVFPVTIAQRRAMYTAEVEQVGEDFFLRIGNTEFRTEFLKTRTFEIPFDRWCAATGTGVSREQLRQWVDGTVFLQSPLGLGWHGVIRITGKTLPANPDETDWGCFLPIKPPYPSETFEIPITLERR